MNKIKAKKFFKNDNVIIALEGFDLIDRECSFLFTEKHAVLRPYKSKKFKNSIHSYSVFDKEFIISEDVYYMLSERDIFYRNFTEIQGVYYSC